MCGFVLFVWFLFVCNMLYVEFSLDTCLLVTTYQISNKMWMVSPIRLLF